MRSFWSIAILVLAACAPAQQQRATAPAATPSALENGRSIFTTGRDLAGVHITASPRPLRPACMLCHGANGAGGMHFPDGVVSADLRHNALVTTQHPPYTIALVERAISTGIDNTGQSLNPMMPRWKMSKRDLHDLAEYVYRELK
jgi:cytochrome c oxidase subunit 2